MKKHLKILLAMIIVASMITACSTVAEDNPTAKPVASEKPGVTQAPGTSSPSASGQPVETASPGPSSEPTPEPESAVSKVTLTNSSDSTGNFQYQAAHYGLHIAYTGEYIELMSYMTLLQHGGDIAAEPVVLEGFEYQAEDLQSYNGRLYFLQYDFDNGVYYLYSYDYENPPVKVTDSTVYHYEFIDGRIYYTKDFVQGPIYSMAIDGSDEKQLTQMRAHSFASEGNSLYFYATDAGTAPGLVKYNISTGEETTVVFPFYSHNYLIHGGYAYYVNEGTYRSIHRVNLANQTVEDLWLEISDYTISMNISDGMLYILTSSGIYKSNTDGSGRTLLYEAVEYLQTGLYIFGDRIYVTDGYDVIVIDRDDGTSYSYPLY